MRYLNVPVDSIHVGEVVYNSRTRRYVTVCTVDRTRDDGAIQFYNGRRECIGAYRPDASISVRRA